MKEVYSWINVVLLFDQMSDFLWQKEWKFCQPGVGDSDQTVSLSQWTAGHPDTVPDNESRNNRC